jgi:hypothetical protein
MNYFSRAALGQQLRLLFSILLFSAVNCQAAGLGNPEVNVPQQLVATSLSQDVPANDPQVAKARDQLEKVMKATGEDAQVIAASCVRNARYIFDSSHQRASPLEVLEALAQFAPPGKPLSDTTQRYSALRAQQHASHAAAMAQMGPAGK